jgi:hypothetical protein
MGKYVPNEDRRNPMAIKYTTYMALRNPKWP